MSKLKELRAHGQSIWLDYIRRSLITSGELNRLIEDGILGLTSNPSIFEQAIAESSEYQVELYKLTHGSLSSKKIYEQLAIGDIQIAADAFRSVYESTAGRDGFVSLEVSPELAQDAAGTVAEARRLWKTVDRHNLMIKVPATTEGLSAIELLISEGINVNVTLLFSVDVYEKVADRYVSGLAQRSASGHDIGRVASVASFFVSRVDAAVDGLLQARIVSSPTEQQPALKALLGKAAIANAKLAYAHYQTVIATPLWKALELKGAQPQRVLWASTGTKNPAYRDLRYIEELIGKDTVNTVPPVTLDAFREHGSIRDSLTEAIIDAHATFEGLSLAGISMKQVTQSLLDDGQKLFAEAFRKVLKAVDDTRNRPALAASAHI